MIGWLRQGALQLLAWLPEDARARVTSMAARVGAVPGLVSRLATLGSSLSVTPELLAALRDPGRRVLQDPRVLLELLEHLEPVWEATLTWLETREVTEAQLEALLQRLSERLVALWSRRPDQDDGERLLVVIEELAATWLEVLSSHLTRREAPDDVPSDTD